jgi:hypothetical protein
VVTCNDAAFEVTVMLKLAVALCAGLLVSATFTPNDDVPVEVGVPLILPEPLKDKPAGNDPEAKDQLYGVLPPAANKDAE